MVVGNGLRILDRAMIAGYACYSHYWLNPGSTDYSKSLWLKAYLRGLGRCSLVGVVYRIC